MFNCTNINSIIFCFHHELEPRWQNEFPYSRNINFIPCFPVTCWHLHSCPLLIIRPTSFVHHLCFGLHSSVDCPFSSETACKKINVAQFFSVVCIKHVYIVNPVPSVAVDRDLMVSDSWEFGHIYCEAFALSFWMIWSSVLVYFYTFIAEASVHHFCFICQNQTF